jgi:hypothetical protein
VGVLSCALASGIVFGFAALKSVLIEEEVYRESCTKEELVDNARVCYMQDLRYCVPELSYIIVSLPHERTITATDSF